MNKRKTSKLAIIYGLIFIITTGIKLNLYASDNELVPSEYAKIRVWTSNLQEKRVGHASLETSMSYISIWPDSKSPNAQFLTINDCFNPCMFAPALSIPSYKYDCRLEDNKDADHVYLIKLNSGKIDRLWKNLLNNYSEEHPTMPGIKKLTHATWFAPSGSTVPTPHKDKLHINCASAILLALHVGEVDVSNVLSHKKAAHELVTQTVSTLAESQSIDHPTTQLVQMIAMFGCYQSIVKPNDIGEFLSKYISERTLNGIRNLVQKDKLKFTGNTVTATDSNMIIDIIVSQFPELFNERTAVRECLCSFGDLEKQGDRYVLSLNQETISLLQGEKKTQARVLGATFGALVGGGLASATSERNKEANALVGGTVGGVLSLAAAECFIQ